MGHGVSLHGIEDKTIGQQEEDRKQDAHPTHAKKKIISLDGLILKNVLKLYQQVWIIYREAQFHLIQLNY
ncbi:hypothetical protein J7D46_25365, partial [Escherichia coli]|uniref:hypothetical protein n=1 Tax=Escherichia coli TaxID=562 RepID=UPI001AD88B7E